jgi:hypothetical protein
MDKNKNFKKIELIASHTPEHPGKLEYIEAAAEMDQTCFDSKSELYSEKNKEVYKKMRAHHGI